MTYTDPNQIADGRNPFAEIAGDSFAGRIPELEWIADGLRTGARLFLQGEKGMGKTALLERAGLWLAERGLGRFLRVDTTQSAGQISQQLHAWTDQLRSELGLAPEQPTSALARGAPSSIQGPSLFPALQRLNELVHRTQVPIGVGFDDLKATFPISDRSVFKDINSAAGKLEHLGLVVASDEPFSPLAISSASRVLDPVDRPALVKKIDQQFATLGPVKPGIGEACFTLGGPVTAGIVQLAERAFSAAVPAKEKGPELVRASLDAMTKQKEGLFQQMWNRFLPVEQAALRHVALSAETVVSPKNLEHLADGSRALASLFRKGALGSLPNGVIYFLDTAFKNWTGQISMQVNAAADLPAKGEKSFQFNFGVRATATRGPGVHL